MLPLPVDHVDVGDNAELAEIYGDDQRDRVGDRLAPESAQRDAGRRTRGMAMLLAGSVRTPSDCYRLAMILQHSGSTDHLQLGCELARRAADAGHPPARWLAAAAMDRWLMHSGLPQKFGTQYVAYGDGAWSLYPVAAGTTDAERRAWHVPSLSEARARVQEMNEKEARS